jgi:prepilin-type N-terminal cleavage/methylation domain-containing protein
MIPGGIRMSTTIPATMEMSRTSLAMGPTARPAEMDSMPISSVGKTSRAGITLIEMMVVVTIIALMVGISFPAITSGIDSLRLNAATNGVVSFFNAGLNRAERRQQVVAITISKVENEITMRSTEPGFVRKLEIPQGVTITHIFPELPDNPDASRNFLLYPGGTVPRFGVQLMNRRNVERIVRVDPITGVPRVERVEQ